MRLPSFGAAIILALTCLTGRAEAQSIQAGSISLRLDSIATLNTAQTGAPNWGAHVGDSRLFVAGQGGQIVVIDNGTMLGTPFLNIPAALGSQFINANDERGFLGFAFHPDFNNAASPGFGKLYTYTSENPGSNAPHFSHPELSGNGTHQSVIREWTVSDSNPNVVDTSLGSRVVMRVRQPQNNHNGGALVFGPDKNLYIAFGDGGGGNDFSGSISSTTDGHTNAPNPNPSNLPHGNAQDITNIYGSIVRIKPTIDNDGNSTLSANGQYRIPNSNPFAGSTTGVDEIYAYGMRNPFRISFDSATGKLYAADVGQGQREEINVVVNGGNYGWVFKEGSISTPGMPAYTQPGNLIDPIAEYTHSDGIAVIGGFVYRGAKIPELVGKYVFGELDHPSGDRFGRLFYMDVNDPGPNQIFEFSIDMLGDALPASQLHGFGEGSNGEIYALFRNGQVVELVPEPASFLLAAASITALFVARRRQENRR